MSVHLTQYEVMDGSPSNESAHSMVAYVLFLLGAVFIGPLEAALGLVLYWMLGDQPQPQTDRS